MSYLDFQQQTYSNVLELVDEKISKGKDIKSLRKSLIKQINRIEELKQYK
jgi:hypothetical protein